MHCIRCVLFGIFTDGVSIVPAAETRLVSYFLAQLNLIERCYFYRSSTGAAQGANRFVRFGIPGQADISGIAASTAVYVEAKTETGKQSEDQKIFQANVERAGAIYIIARNKDEAVDPVRRIIAAAKTRLMCAAAIGHTGPHLFLTISEFSQYTCNAHPAVDKP